jgi:glutathione transport system permease protein
LLLTAPHIAIIPCTVILLLVLSFNIVGDALRDALDPQLRV